MLGAVADLSGGGAEPPPGGLPGRPLPGEHPWSLVARGPGGVFAASSREQLGAAVATAKAKVDAPHRSSRAGWSGSIRRQVRDQPRSRLDAALRLPGRSGVSSSRGGSGLIQSSLLTSWVGRFRGRHGRSLRRLTRTGLTRSRAVGPAGGVRVSGSIPAARRGTRLFCARRPGRAGRPGPGKHRSVAHPPGAGCAGLRRPRLEPDVWPPPPGGLGVGGSGTREARTER